MLRKSTIISMGLLLSLSSPSYSASLESEISEIEKGITAFFSRVGKEITKGITTDISGLQKHYASSSSVPAVEQGTSATPAVGTDAGQQGTSAVSSVGQGTFSSADVVPVHPAYTTNSSSSSGGTSSSADVVPVHPAYTQQPSSSSTTPVVDKAVAPSGVVQDSSADSAAVKVTPAASAQGDGSSAPVVDQDSSADSAVPDAGRVTRPVSAVIYDSHFWEEGTPWAVQAEFNKVFNKLRPPSFILKNCTKERVQFKAVGVRDGRIEKIRFSLDPEEKFRTPQMTRYLGVRPEGSSTVFLNLKSHGSDTMRIDGEEAETVAFPPHYPPFDFIPHYFPDPKGKMNHSQRRKYEALLSKGLTDKFMEDFNNNYNYITYALCPGERIDSRDLFAQRERLYHTNNPNRLLSLDRAEAAPRIPLRSNRVWLTSERGAARELPDDYIDWMVASASVDPDGESTLWVLNKDDLPRTMERLSDTPIKVREIRKEFRMRQLGSLFEETLEISKYGRASDMARMELLAETGGIFEDIDFRRHQSIRPFAHAYDFLVGLEPMSVFLGNAFVGASPHHPIVSTYLNLVERNYDPDRVPEYIKRVDEADGFKTILLTGPAVLTTAFYKAAGRAGKVDAVMPPDVFYPTVHNYYPHQEVVKPGDPLPIYSVGAHYWETSWMRFGSKG